MSIEEARSELRDLMKRVPPHLVSLIELADQLLNEFHVSSEKRRTLVTLIQTVIIRALLEALQSLAIDIRDFGQKQMGLYRAMHRYYKDIVKYANLDALCGWLSDIFVVLSNNPAYMRWVRMQWMVAEKAVKMAGSR
jgi:hypothetical protein